MKKLICFLLAIAMAVSLPPSVLADEPEEPQYGIIKVEYSDARGTTENLDVMVLNGFVYAHLESFVHRLKFDWVREDDVVSIYALTSIWGAQAPALALHFCINSRTVSYNPLCGIEVEYTAPAPCIENDRGIWIPLTYTLTLLGGSRNIAGDVLVIQIPSPNILSVAATIVSNEAGFSFDWVDDFGYDEKTVNKTDGAARIVTLFSGLLKFDGSAWSSFVDWDAFDKKFGKTLAAMLCTYSSEELNESIEEVELLVDVFDSNGALGSMLRTQQALIDSDVNAWDTICQEQLKKLKEGSGTLPQYNMAYQQYERATKKQDLFSAVGADDLIYLQDGLSAATDVLDHATKIGNAVSYLTEFQQRDEFQATVLENYFSTRKDTDKLDDATAKAIADYASSGIIEYTVRKYVEEHLLESIVEDTGLDALMGAPANLLLLAWDIMSETIPFYKNGLKSVEAREISTYAQQLQRDAYQNLNTLIASIRADTSSLSPEDCVQLAEYCYVYLKACYIARSSAIDSLKDISEEARKKLESKMNVETEINRKIATYLAILGQADLNNSCYILGFLPQNNRELLEVYSDTYLLTIVREPEKQLTQINKYDESGSLQIEERIYYTTNGLRSRIITSNIEQQLDISETFVYDHNDLLIESHFESDWGFSCFYTYNEYGQLIEADTGFGWEWYEYDSSGNLLKIKESYDAFDSVTTNEYSLDTLLRSKTEFTNDDGTKHTEVTTFTYDAQNRLIQEVCEGGTTNNTHRYDYSLNNIILVENLTNTNRDSITAFIQDTHGKDIITLNLCNPLFFVDEEGYLAKIIDKYTSQGTVTTEVYTFYYDDIQAIPQNTPTSTTIALEEVQEHTYEDVEDLLYKYLAEEYGTEGLEIWHQTGNKFQMTISGNPGPVYIINWYLVDMDTGLVKNEETGTIICDLW